MSDLDYFNFMTVMMDDINRAIFSNPKTMQIGTFKFYRILR